MPEASVTIVLADKGDFAGMNDACLRWIPSDPAACDGAQLPAPCPLDPARDESVPP